MTHSLATQFCPYCLGPLHVGEADEPLMQGACSVPVHIGLICRRCGYVGQSGRPHSSSFINARFSHN